MSVNITYRGSIASAAVAKNSVFNKNAPLTNAEIDGNFKSIQDEMSNFTVNADDVQFSPTTDVISSNLQAAIEEVSGKISTKQNTLLSGTNIKTIEGSSILGSGDINLVSVAGQSLIGSNDIEFKTVNNQSIVGSGNITITSGVVIQDTSTSSTTGTWSASKIHSSITAMGSGIKSELLNGADPAFDTLSELAAVLNSGTGVEVAITQELSKKQTILVDSGTDANIKTIENQSLLGSGNIDLKSVGGTSLIGSGNIEFKTVGGSSLTGTGDISVSTIDDSATDASATWSAEKIIQELSNVTPSSTSITNVATIQEMSYSMGSETAIDLSKASVFQRTLTTTTKLTFTSPASKGFVSTCIVELSNSLGVAPVVNWPDSVKWQDGIKPTLTANSTDIFGFYTRDEGITYRGLVLAKNSK